VSNPSKAEKKRWDQIAQLGCLPCKQDGFLNTLVSIHHVDGRTKPDAHKKVLALCAGHHQQGSNTNNPNMLAVHGNKARFEAKYGTQQELLTKTKELLCQKE
jgi:hypothetical protein